MSPTTATNITYYSLPVWIRHDILKILVKDGVACASLAVVSREWQAIIERHNFARLKVTPKRLSTFYEMTLRNQHLVRYIWLCLQISEYRPCAAWGVVGEDNTLITEAVESLFSSLSTWKSFGDLTLDISVYSPSDARHPSLKCLTFEPDLNPRDCPRDREVEEEAQRMPPRNHQIDGFVLVRLFDDLLYMQGSANREFDDMIYWLSGAAATDPDFAEHHPTLSDHEAFDRLLTEIEQSEDGEDELLECWEQMPSAPAVTCILLRQQTRRTWPPEQLCKLFACLPGIQEIHYEPWRDFLAEGGRFDDDLETLLPQSCLKTLKRLVLFENFNEMYPEIIQRTWLDLDTGPSPGLRKPSPDLSAALARTSLGLESLSAAFSADASYFLIACHSSWTWSKLSSLTITSRLLRPGADLDQLETMLREAAAVAMRMPKLETLEIWEGRKGIAALFRYRSRPARLTWKATWDFRIPDSVTRAWDKVAMTFYGGECAVVEQMLDGATIKSHGDSIVALQLSQMVVRPVSLQQIRREQRYLDP
ncbi:unnamed protein product [Clonostachys rosea]|uniref:DUF6546 domain-containing protein n=1 Tax=Bionectria ochroleuca TaxID=29856 RepID=A0ABY6UTA7_BIOOC|nr:unnamed protein product [Clonostachys rosea]